MPVKHITLDDYKNDYLSKDNHVLIDVREVDEFAMGRIPHAVNVPITRLQFTLEDIPEDKEVVIVCARGGRSTQASAYIAAQGYDNITNITEGTADWQERGWELER